MKQDYLQIVPLRKYLIWGCTAFRYCITPKATRLQTHEDPSWCAHILHGADKQDFRSYTNKLSRASTSWLRSGFNELSLLVFVVVCVCRSCFVADRSFLSGFTLVIKRYRSFHSINDLAPRSEPNFLGCQATQVTPSFFAVFLLFFPFNFLSLWLSFLQSRRVFSLTLCLWHAGVIVSAHHSLM